jgi:hypothetical protein
MSSGPDTIRLGLNRGELTRAGVAKVPNSHSGADLALGVLSRELFEAWPHVGGCGMPERFVVDKHTMTDHPMFVGAFVTIWSNKTGGDGASDNADMYKSIRKYKNFGGYCDVHVADVNGLDIGSYLSVNENVVANTLKGDSAGLLAIDAGLHYLGRRK